ncbi:hypothetical protein WDZ92_01230 [Nostoc sp. NIES-2111]
MRFQPLLREYRGVFEEAYSYQKTQTPVIWDISLSHSSPAKSYLRLFIDARLHERDGQEYPLHNEDGALPELKEHWQWVEDILFSAHVTCDFKIERSETEKLSLEEQL